MADKSAEMCGFHLYHYVFPNFIQDWNGLTTLFVACKCPLRSANYNQKLNGLTHFRIKFYKHLFNLRNENQLMSLFYSYIAGSLHVSGPQAHLQESLYSCSHNHWFSFCAALFACSVCCQNTRTQRHRNWTNGCVNSCMNSPEDGPVGPKHVEIQQYTNKTVTSVGFHSICWKDARYKKLKTCSTIHQQHWDNLKSHSGQFV